MFAFAVLPTLASGVPALMTRSCQIHDSRTIMSLAQPRYAVIVVGLPAQRWLRLEGADEREADLMRRGPLAAHWAFHGQVFHSVNNGPLICC